MTDLEKIFGDKELDVYEFVSIESDKSRVYINLTPVGSLWPGPIEARFQMPLYNALCLGESLIREANKAAGTPIKKSSKKGKEAV